LTYDAVVLDAPPTGRIAQFLGVNQELAGLARMGPIKSQAESVTGLFRSPQTAVHIVTVLEEMPVQETADGIAELREHGLPVGGVVVNQVRPRDLDEDDLAAVRAGKVTKRAVAADLNRAGLSGSGDLVLGLLAEARDHAERRALEDAQRTVVAGLGVPTYDLPLLAGGVDLGALYELAGLLRDQGLA
jgi:anion-transporting  ArsA/GET3 family ATPase